MPDNPWWYIQEPIYTFECKCGRNKYFLMKRLEDIIEKYCLPELQGFSDKSIPRPHLEMISSKMRCVTCETKGKFLVKRWSGDVIFDNRMQ